MLIDDITTANESLPGVCRHMTLKDTTDVVLFVAGRGPEAR